MFNRKWFIAFLVVLITLLLQVPSGRRPVVARRDRANGCPGRPAGLVQLADNGLAWSRS